MQTGFEYAILSVRHIKAQSVIKEHDECQKKDETAKTVFCSLERASDQMEDTNTNIPIPLVKRSLFIHGS